MLCLHPVDGLPDLKGIETGAGRTTPPGRRRTVDGLPDLKGIETYLLTPVAGSPMWLSMDFPI